MPVFDALIKPALDSVTALVQQFHLSPDEKQKFEQATAELAQKTQQQANDYEVSLNTIAGQNIRAEAQSGDRFVERSRPAVIWMGNALLLWNYGLVPVIGAHWHLQPATLPDAFWWTWSAIVGGYVFTRSAEKIASMPGDSQINLPFLKLGNKSGS